MKRIMIIAGLALMAVPLVAQSVRIAQVDTSRLLVGGTIDAYVSVTNGSSGGVIPAEAEAWRATELIGGQERGLEIVEVREGISAQVGIDFMLLVDNSGSMYETSPSGGTRMDQAQAALESFLTSIAASEDRVALGAFNTFVYPLAPLGATTGELSRSLTRIEQPETEAAYTELYQAASRQLSEFDAGPRRRAVIVLTDGEDYPFSIHAGVEHPVWNRQVLSPDEVVRRYREEEVTLYAISFADAPNADLSRIATETGGEVFEAYDADELTDVYEAIRDSIRGEIRLRLRVPAARSELRSLSVTYRGDEDDAHYLAPLLLGAPGSLSWFVPLLAVVLAAAALAVLHFVSLESAASKAEIQPIGGGKTVVLRDAVTVIGSAPDAQVSLAANKGVELRHATVVHDPEKGSYTLVSERPVRVNNTIVTSRRLRPGDVISVEEATLVFDAPRK